MADLRRVMSVFATGITVITVGGDFPNGMTANAFGSVSLDPPLVLCCVSRTARLHGALSAGGSFAVSVLSAEQEEIARRFADHSRPHGWGQFAPPGWRLGRYTGAPLLDGALAWLECEVIQETVAGDHSVFVASVLDAATGGDRPALLFHGSAFHELRRVPAADVAD
ncbi:flavin reductase (DIM6/NTAB) family NADH-FMN oxidoreductase RutF [Nocardiopsis arvandica]|uniref:Flavin reductase (DIM6/NTAB) family NADH-FMN oxidoreductase RutF n=1 Tax=Nocardiopsis sinuspersici TaxID=501010 RepID=A0A7Z0BI26_9ACTN|nr:flavin reductase family protein [Nocardiopsis sinuspersici]NYH50595.1 flavin reductase (DIM6/NTAB) family NADH-FMN oxidoreductase RutF [Nocardiopsis sinuspersici]